MDDRPLVITADDAVLDDVLRLAAAAAVDVLHSREPVSRARWRAASVVLLDVAAVRAAVAAELPRRPGVVVVAMQEPTGDDWPACIRLGVERTVVLGSTDQYLIDLLNDAAPAGPGDGRTVAVIGGCGGSGASVLSVALAVAGHRSGHSVLLADLDRWGPGLDVLLGLENHAGARWSDLAASSGRLPTDALHQALPAIDIGGGRIPVLCQDHEPAGDVSAELLEVVVESGRRAGDLTVADLPRHASPTADRAAELADLVVLITTADLRGCFAARRVARRLNDLGARAGLVVRGPSPGGLGAGDLSSSLGLPLIASMRPQPGLARGLERCEVPGAERGPLASTAVEVVRALQPVVR